MAIRRPTLNRKIQISISHLFRVIFSVILEPWFTRLRNPTKSETRVPETVCGFMSRVAHSPRFSVLSLFW